MRALHQIAVTALALSMSALTLSAQSARTDDQIENDIESQIANSSTLSGQAIGIWTHDGVVTLSGQVKDDATRQAVVGTVNHVEGVKSVEDHLLLPGEQAAASQAGADSGTQAQLGTPADQTNQTQQAAAQDGEPPQEMGQQVPAPEQLPETNGGQPPPPSYPSGQPGRQNYPPPASRGNPPSGRYDGYPRQARLQTAAGPITLPPGTFLNVRIEQGLDTRHTKPGMTFRAVTAQNVFAQGYVVIPRGTYVEGTVVDVQTAGDFKGSPKLRLQLTSLALDNQSYPVQSNIWNRKGPGKGEQTIGNTIGGAALGAVIGAIAGGGPGAAIGAGVGGVAAAGVSGAVPARDLLVRPESVLTFSLAAPLTVQPVAQDELDRMVAQERDQRANAPRYASPRRRIYPYPYAYPYPPPPPPPPYYGPYYR